MHFIIMSDKKNYVGERGLTPDANEARKYTSFVSVASDFESGDECIVLMNEGGEKCRFDWNEHIELRNLLLLCR